MFFRILKKDLKRKKTMNIILFLFVVLATMFVSSGLNNVLTVATGTEYYLDKAGVGDYVAITIGDEGRGYLDKALADEEAVMAYRIEPIITGNQNNLTLENGEEAVTKNALIIQNMESSVIKFFDLNNEPVTEVEKGHAYVSGAFMEKNGLEVGDKIVLDHSGTRMELILDGKVKDALLGSDFMGNTRIIINQEDMEIFSANEEIMKYYAGEICYIETDDTDAVGRILTEIPDLNFSGIRSTLKLCYVMDMIVAFVVLILSVCLMIVSFVVLKFSITFTISEEFREIGVMKAIGITNRRIRLLYIGKYLMISLVGALGGLILSVPFGNLLIKSVSENMVMGNSMGIVLNILGALIVVATILLFAYRCTGKVKKSSPVDAIRTGQTGERYKKKTIYRIGKSHTRPSIYMAINDVISSPKRYMTIILSFFICMLFVLVLVNTTETMKSDKLIYTFGTKADLYMTDVEMAMEDMESDNRFLIEAELDEESKRVSDMGMPCIISAETQYKYPVTLDGTRYLITASQGFNISAAEYKYLEGIAPAAADEIAITPIVSEKLGLEIGDTITIHFGEQDMDCMVTAYFETMNQLGELIILHEDAPTDMSFCANVAQYKYTFTDSPDEEEILHRKERLIEYYNNEDVMTAAEFCEDCVSVADTMEAVQYLLLGITLVVVILVTILMERSFIADEKSQIAILKAIGFKNKDIVKWHTYRFAFVGLIAVILAALVSVPMTDLCISPVFGMMGANDIDFNIVPWKVFALYPIIVVAVTVFISWITSQYTKTIKSSDTAHIE